MRDIVRLTGLGAAVLLWTRTLACWWTITGIIHRNLWSSQNRLLESNVDTDGEQQDLRECPASVGWVSRVSINQWAHAHRSP